MLDGKAAQPSRAVVLVQNGRMKDVQNVLVANSQIHEETVFVSLAQKASTKNYKDKHSAPLVRVVGTQMKINKPSAESAAKAQRVKKLVLALNRVPTVPLENTPMKKNNPSAKVVQSVGVKKTLENKYAQVALRVKFNQ